MTQTKPAQQQSKAAMQKSIKEEIIANVKSIVSKKIVENAIHIPDNYSYENALEYAWMDISSQEVSIPEEENGRKKWTKVKMLDLVDKVSVAEALFNMVVEGTNPGKNQCAFIKYGDKLTYQRMYPGDIALAKRYSGVKEVRAREIYKGTVERGDFVTEVLKDGREVLIKHNTTLEDMDTDIVGGYCVIINKDGEEELIKMTINKIKTSWSQGKNYKEDNSDGIHSKFDEEMVKRTLIRRACKPFINSTSDESIIHSISEQETVDIAHEEESSPKIQTIEVKSNGIEPSFK